MSTELLVIDDEQRIINEASAVAVVGALRSGRSTVTNNSDDLLGTAHDSIVSKDIQISWVPLFQIDFWRWTG